MKIGILFGVTLAASLAAASAHAATVTVNTNNAGVSSTSALTGFATTGNMMGGMSITATFDDGQSETVSWVNGGGTFGSAVGALFSLSLDGDTFSAPWVLSNLLTSATLTTLHINAGVGDTVFDIIGTPEGTLGSASGAPFSQIGGAVDDPAGNIVATYSQPVKLDADAVPFGDLFAQLLVDFTGLDRGGMIGTFSFGADTDNLELPGDLRTTPIPGALPLFVSGLVAFGWAARRRRRTTQAAA